MSCAEPCHQDFHFPFHGKSVGNKVASTIAAAYRSLGFSSLAETFGAWYVSRTPTGKTITDETPSRKDRTELATTGSVFNGSDQYFQKTDIANAVLGSDDTSFTVRIVLEADPSMDQYTTAIHCMDGSPAEGWKIDCNSSVDFSVVNGAGSTIVADSGINRASFAAWGRMEIVGVYDSVADMIHIYVDGVLKDSQACVGYTAPTQNKIKIGVRSDTSAYFFYGQGYEAQVWNDQALTAAEIVKLHDKEISYFQNDKAPSVAWLLDGPTCTDLIGDNDLMPQADPAAYVGSEGSNWLNDQGWSFGNQGRILNFYNSSSVFTFECKIPSSESPVYFLAGSANGENAAIAQNGSAATAYGDCTSIKIDGVELSDLGGSTRTDFYNAVCDDQTHTVAITSKAQMVAWTYINYGIAVWTSSTINEGYLRLIDIDGEEPNIDLTSSDTLLAPKRWAENQDTDGYAGDANSFGQCKRNREYRNGPAINLNGIDQYGVKPNTHDYSGEDWTLSGYVSPATVSGTNIIFSQLAGTGTARSWLYHVGAKWYSVIAGTATSYTGISNIVVGKEYYFEFEKSSDLFTLRVTNLSDGTATESHSETRTMESADGNLLVGVNSVYANHFDGKIWGLQLDCTTDPTKSFNYPISEEVGIISHDTLNPTLPITWQGDPTWDFTVNDSFFHGETVGWTTGPDFITPDFAESDWEIEDEFSIADGKLTKVAGSNQSAMQAFAFPIAGGDYDVTFTIAAPVSASIHIRSSNNSNGGGNQTNTSITHTGGEQTVRHTPHASNAYLGFGSTSSGTATISNISVKSVAKIPLKTDGTAIHAGSVVNKAGPHHNDTQAEMTETPVANSDSVNPIYYCLDFANVGSGNVLADTAITGFPFSIKADLMWKDGGQEYFVFLTEDSVRYFGIWGTNSGGFGIIRRNNGSAETDIVTGDTLDQNVFHTVEAVFTSATTATVTINGVTTEMTGLPSVAEIAPTTDGLILGQYRGSLGVTANSRIKNVIVKQGDTIINDLPLYKDALDRSSNCNHGTLSATGVSFLSNTMETDTTPEIAESETRAVTNGDRKIISIGAR